MHSPETIAMFNRLIQQAIASASQLALALEDEREALGQADPGVLTEAVEAKLARLSELEQRLAAHEGFLAARRLPPGRRGTEIFLHRLPGRAAERVLWEQLQQLAAHCRERNEVNGSVVALRTVRTRRALQVLTEPCAVTT